MTGVTYRCECGHFEEEHSPEGGCAGCGAAGRPVEVIDHAYVADPMWPEPPDIDPYDCPGDAPAPKGRTWTDDPDER